MAQKKNRGKPGVLVEYEKLVIRKKQHKINISSSIRKNRLGRVSFSYTAAPKFTYRNIKASTSYVQRRNCRKNRRSISFDLAKHWWYPRWELSSSYCSYWYTSQALAHPELSPFLALSSLTTWTQKRQKKEARSLGRKGGTRTPPTGGVTVGRICARIFLADTCNYAESFIHRKRILPIQSIQLACGSRASQAHVGPRQIICHGTRFWSGL